MDAMALALGALSNPMRVDGNGIVRIGQSRVTLETVVRRFLVGDSPEEIADAYALDLADVYATVSYYLQHRDDVNGYLQSTENEEARVARLIQEKSNPSALRDRLLARLASGNRGG